MACSLCSRGNWALYIVSANIKYTVQRRRTSSVEDALVAGVPERIWAVEGVGVWLIRDNQILVCPQIVGEHNGKGIECSTLTVIRKLSVAHCLVKVGKRIHSLCHTNSASLNNGTR